MADEISLKVAGVNYAGWQSVRLERAIGQISGAFGFQATDIFPGQSEKWAIRMGQECVVEVNGEVSCTGYVDGIDIEYTENSHTIEVRGRDKTADLVDCSWDSTKVEWKNVTVLSIIEDLCDVYSIEVVVDSSVGTALSERVITFKVNEGDSIFDTIARLLSIKAVLPITHGDGKLTLTRRGSLHVSDRIEQGKNVKAGAMLNSDLDRYSVYVVKSQGIGVDTWDVGSINQANARVLDLVMPRTRPLVIFASRSSTSAQCRDRAEWEMRTRYGKSRRLEYELVGWTQSNGDLWPLNRLVIVQDDILGVTMDVEGGNSYLITAISQEYDDSTGSITRLKLEPPDAYELIRQSVTKKTSFDIDPKALKDFLDKYGR